MQRKLKPVYRLLHGTQKGIVDEINILTNNGWKLMGSIIPFINKSEKITTFYATIYKYEVNDG